MDDIFHYFEDGYQLILEQQEINSLYLQKLLITKEKIIEEVRLQFIIITNIFWFLLIYYEKQFEYWEEIYLLWFTFFLNLILIFLTFLSYFTNIEFKKQAGIIEITQIFWKIQEFYHCLIEVALLLVFPNNFTIGNQFQLQKQIENKFYYYTINELLTLISTFRFLQVLIIYLRLSQFRNSQTQRLLQLNGNSLNNSLMCKYLINKQPCSMILYLFIVFFIYTTQAMWIAEIPIWRDDNHIHLFQECYLQVAYSLARHNYEGYIPKTTLGRLVLGHALFAGFEIFSIMVRAIVQILSYDVKEISSQNELEKLSLMKSMQQVSTNILYLYYQYNYEAVYKSELQIKISNQIYKQSKVFQILKQQYSFTNCQTETDILSRQLKGLISQLKIIKAQYKLQLVQFIK